MKTDTECHETLLTDKADKEVYYSEKTGKTPNQLCKVY